MNVKTRKLIQKYAKLRGEGTPSLKLDILFEVYEKANKVQQAFYRAEMRDYIKSVEDKELEPGQPITEARPNLARKNL